MEFEKDFIEKQGLSEGQVTALKELTTKHVDNIVAETKKEYDGKANTDAEAILTGAADKIKDETKIERKQGEKLADYYTRAWTESNVTKTSELETAKNDYLEKVKGVAGNEGIVKELDETKLKLDDTLKQLVDFDTVKKTAEKLEPLEKEYAQMKEQVAYGTVKPAFPKEVNEFEAKARWNEFKKTIRKEWDIELVEGEAIAISKENNHKREKLKDLLDKNEPITKLLEGRKQAGPNGTETQLKTIEGVPFEVPVDAPNSKISELIGKHLAKKGIESVDPRHATEFRQLFDKIKKPETVA